MSEARSPIVSGRNLTLGYDELVVLDKVAFDIYDRDFIGVIGPNGGGKTSFIKAILRLITPTSGELTYYSEGREVPEIEIGYVPQQNAIDRAFPISVSEVVSYGLLRPGKQRFTREERQRVATVLDQVGMTPYAHTPIGALSGGQLQRVLLARAIVSTPTLLILDEPNTYVDKHFESQLYALLPEINQHSAVLIVSHDIGAVSRMVRRLFCIHRNLHIHDHIDLSCDDCSDNNALHYLSLIDHR